MDALPPPAHLPALVQAEPLRGGLPTGGDQLRDYLAAHDEPCPHCGYNLRGVEDPRCPECGQALRLAVQGAKARSGYLWFLLLALGWVFLASGMNAARYGREAYEEARSPFVLLPGASIRYSFQSTPSGAVITYGARGATIFPAAPAAGGAVPPPPSLFGAPQGATSAERAAAARARAALQTQAQLRSLIQGAPILPGVASPPPGGLSLNFSAVRPATWVNLGWWGALALAALGSLAAVAVVWPRRKTTAPRPLLVLACTLFVLYAAYHTVMFARDIAA
jgi:hypothetical protein